MLITKICTLYESPGAVIITLCLLWNLWIGKCTKKRLKLVNAVKYFKNVILPYFYSGVCWILPKITTIIENLLHKSQKYLPISNLPTNGKDFDFFTTVNSTLLKVLALHLPFYWTLKSDLRTTSVLLYWQLHILSKLLCYLSRTCLSGGYPNSC